MTTNRADHLRRIHGNWGSNPEHPVSDWQAEVANDETRLGYWEWLEVVLDEDDE